MGRVKALGSDQGLMGALTRRSESTRVRPIVYGCLLLGIVKALGPNQGLMGALAGQSENI